MMRDNPVPMGEIDQNDDESREAERLRKLALVKDLFVILLVAIVAFLFVAPYWKHLVLPVIGYMLTVPIGLLALRKLCRKGQHPIGVFAFPFGSFFLALYAIPTFFLVAFYLPPVALAIPAALSVAVIAAVVFF